MLRCRVVARSERKAVYPAVDSLSRPEAEALGPAREEVCPGSLKRGHGDPCQERLRRWRERHAEARGQKVEVARADSDVVVEVARAERLPRLSEMTGKQVEVGGADGPVVVGIPGEDEEVERGDRT